MVKARFVSYLFLLITTTTVCSSSCKDSQFATTIIITDSVITQGGMDTMTTVLKKRMDKASFKGAKVIGDIGKKEIKIVSKKLEEDFVNDYICRRGKMMFYECMNFEELLRLIEREKADKLAGLFVQVSMPQQDFNRMYNPPTLGICSAGNVAAVEKEFEKFKSSLPNILLFFNKVEETGRKKNDFVEVYALKDDITKLDVSNYIKSALPGLEPTSGKAEVLMEFDNIGAKLWGIMTTRNVGHAIAMAVDGKILSTPIVNDPILNGYSAISLASSDKEKALKEASQLAAALSSGSLPYKVKLAGIEPIINKK